MGALHLSRQSATFVGGLTFGKITGFAADPLAFVGAFFIAPDHSRAGLIGVLSANDYFRRVCPSPGTREFCESRLILAGTS
jgi:hypothetical protein